MQDVGSKQNTRGNSEDSILIWRRSAVNSLDSVSLLEIRIAAV